MNASAAAGEMMAPTKPPRRRLRLTRVEDALAEADRLAAAERAGRLRCAGNWTAGQTLGHLATWADFAFDGYPPELRTPLPVRVIARLLRNRILTKGMAPGMRLGKMPGGTLGIEPMTTEAGLARFRAAMTRLGETDPKIPNPVFGPLTHEQWIQLNLRHAELHLGFLVPTDAPAT